MSRQVVFMKSFLKKEVFKHAFILFYVIIVAIMLVIMAVLWTKLNEFMCLLLMFHNFFIQELDYFWQFITKCSNNKHIKKHFKKTRLMLFLMSKIECVFSSFYIIERYGTWDSANPKSHKIISADAKFCGSGW